jgi:hypothetical protein
MKMEGGDYMLRGRVSCFVLYSTTYVCGYLERVQMVVKKMLVLEQENG